MNNKMIKVTKTISKIAEVLAWIGDGLMAVAFIATLIFRNTFDGILLENIENGNLTVTGFDVTVLDTSKGFLTFPVYCALAAGIICLGFMAMIFRNIGLIFKSEKPFCDDTVRMVREIGIFAILIPVAEIVLSIVAQLVGGPMVEVSVSLTTALFGLVVLCLSQFFRYGAELQKDVDGLL